MLGNGADLRGRTELVRVALYHEDGARDAGEAVFNAPSGMGGTEPTACPIPEERSPSRTVKSVQLSGRVSLPQVDDNPSMVFRVRFSTKVWGAIAITERVSLGCSQANSSAMLR